MKPLDILDKNILSLSNAQKFLSSEEYKKFICFSEDKKLELLENLLNKPISEFTEINELFFRTKWASLMNSIYDEQPICLLEIASGDADMIPQSLARSNKKSKYITANMNKLLNESLIKKTKGLALDFKLIDDNAANINNYISPNTVDVIAFQHGVNDVLQGILCSKYGVDTVYSDWMEVLPKMIELINKEINQNSFEQSVKKPFLNLINNLIPLLNKNGIISINHYMFQLDLDWGYPKHLLENLVPIIREWFKQIKSLKEVTFDGFDQQWWIFLKLNS